MHHRSSYRKTQSRVTLNGKFTRPCPWNQHPQCLFFATLNETISVSEASHWLSSTLIIVAVCRCNLPEWRRVGFSFYKKIIPSRCWPHLCRKSTQHSRDRERKMSAACFLFSVSVSLVFSVSWGEMQERGRIWPHALTKVAAAQEKIACNFFFKRVFIKGSDI